MPVMTSQEVRSSPQVSMLVDCIKPFCDLTGKMFYISENKLTLVRFHLRSYESKKYHFTFVLFIPYFGFKYGKINFSINFCQTYAHFKIKSFERSSWFKIQKKCLFWPESGVTTQKKWHWQTISKVWSRTMKHKFVQRDIFIIYFSAC